MLTRSFGKACFLRSCFTLESLQPPRSRPDARFTTMTVTCLTTVSNRQNGGLPSRSSWPPPLDKVLDHASEPYTSTERPGFSPRAFPGCKLITPTPLSIEITVPNGLESFWRRSRMAFPCGAGASRGPPDWRTSWCDRVQLDRPATLQVDSAQIG